MFLHEKWGNGWILKFAVGNSRNTSKNILLSLAKSIGSFPASFFTWISAPRSIRICTTSCRFSQTARCNGVFLTSFFASISLPFDSNSSTVLFKPRKVKNNDFLEREKWVLPKLSQEISPVQFNWFHKNASETKIDKNVQLSIKKGDTLIDQKNTLFAEAKIE